MSSFFKHSGKSRGGKHKKKSSCSESTTCNTESFLHELNSSGGDAIDFISNMSSETVDCMSMNPEAIDNSTDEVVVEYNSLFLESISLSKKDNTDLTEDDVNLSQVMHEQQQMIAKLKAQLAEEQTQFAKVKQNLIESHVAELKRRAKKRDRGAPTDSSKCLDSKSDATPDKFTATRELGMSVYGLHNLLEEASKSTNAWCGKSEPQIRNSEVRASYAKVLNQVHPTQQAYVDSVLPKTLELITECNDILFEMRRNFVKARK